jgi:hypothetical protein
LKQNARISSSSGEGVADDSTTTTDTSIAVTGITAAFGTTARGGAQTSMDFDVKYRDYIACVKD